MNPRKSFHLCVASLFLWICLTRVAGICSKSIWVDEAITWHYAQLGGVELIEEVKRFDSHPPLFYLLAWISTSVFPAEAGIRLPSLLAGLLLPWAIYKLALETEGQGCARLSLVLSGFSAYSLYFSQEARNYGLSALVATLAVLCLIRTRRSPSRASWFTYGLLLLCCMYTYLYLALLLAMLVLWWVHQSFQERKGPWGPWILCHFCSALLFIPWIPVVLRRAALQGDLSGHFEPGWSSWDLVKTINHFSIGHHEYLSHTLGSDLLGPLVLSCILGGLVLGGILGSRERFLWCLLLLGVPCLCWRLPVRLHFYDPKHLYFLLPFFLVCQAKALDNMKRFLWKGSLLGSFLLFNVASTLWYHSPVFQKAGWKDLAFLAAREGRSDDLAVFDPYYVGYALDFYLDKNTVLCNRIGPRMDDPLAELETSMVRGQRVWLFTSKGPVTQYRPEIRRWLEERRMAVADVGFPSQAFPIVGQSESIRMTLFALKELGNSQEGDLSSP